MKSRVLLLVTMLILLAIGLVACEFPEAKRIAQENQIVVECAEPILWDFSYIASPEFGSLETSHIDFLSLLATDDIFLFEDEHPFKVYDDYIAFKADYYREWFAWGNLPPEDIMRKCGVSPP